MITEQRLIREYTFIAASESDRRADAHSYEIKTGKNDVDRQQR
jgi:hypothetical protein